MRQMQLAKPGGLDKFKLNELDIPKPKENEILIKVNASSLNYHDLMCTHQVMVVKTTRINFD